MKPDAVLRNLLLLFCFTAGTCHAQSDSLLPLHYVDVKKELVTVVGYHGARMHFLEGGIGINTHGRVGHHPSAFTRYLGCEIMADRSLVIAPKVALWMCGGTAFAMNLLYYTDLNEATLVFRPEMGVGLSRFKLTYGYNCRLVNKSFDQLNRHSVTLSIAINLKTLEHIQVERDEKQ